MFKFFQKINQVRPKPLKRLQKILGIEEEWRNFKVLIKPHKFKLASIGLIAMFPIYQLCSQYYYNSMKQKVQERIHETKPLSKVSEDFIKQFVENTLVKDPQIKRESAIYGEHVVKNQEALDQILVLLLDGVKDPRFIHEIKGTLKTVGLGAIKDKVIERNSIDFVVEALKDPEVKNEILELGKSIPKDEATKKEVIEFCKSTFLDERMQQRVRELASKTTHDVLTDQATKEQLKLFAFFFLENEAENVRESARGFINDIVDKVKKGHRVENKESEVQRVLEERGQEEAFESIHTRKKSASGSKESDDKAPSF